MGLIKLINLKSFGDERGQLTALEAETLSIPFQIKRVYYLYNTKSQISRGHHAHKNLSQVAICLNGSCRFILDDGTSREEVELDSPTTGLLIQSNIWREMDNFSENSVLLVLASELFDESDYIRNYEEFRKMVNGKK